MLSRGTAGRVGPGRTLSDPVLNDPVIRACHHRTMERLTPEEARARFGASWPIALKKSVPERLDWLSPSGEDGRPWALRQGWRRRRDQLGELPEVLGGGGKVELVSRPVRPS